MNELLYKECDRNDVNQFQAFPVISPMYDPPFSLPPFAK